MFLQDNKSVEELEKMNNPNAAMMNQPGQPKDFKKLFKNEQDFYELVKYEHKLEDVEDAFLIKFK